ncbi:glutathione S-transferase U17-like [Iris pallida]|uniref:Glutathione S-transferase n=1 Tax=Iris pallida TaxID=29817 RepID=A0AAX6HND2_IRIPA|nr:glutathione S-transferase U17-like [Iris pallida]
MAAAAAAGEEEGEVKLLGAWASPFVLRPRIALNMKGVKYEFLEETFGSKSELLLRSNPVYKKIPVLIHAGKPVSESMIIVQYIHDVWGDNGTTPILPAHPTTVPSPASGPSTSTISGSLPWLEFPGQKPTRPKPKQCPKYFQGCSCWKRPSRKSSSNGKGFFGGEAIGYLDIALGSYLGWLKATEKMTGIDFLDQAKTPLLLGWADRFCSHAAVREVMPETDRLVEFAKLLRSNSAAPSPAK